MSASRWGALEEALAGRTILEDAEAMSAVNILRSKGVTIDQVRKVMEYLGAERIAALRESERRDGES